MEKQFSAIGLNDQELVLSDSTLEQIELSQSLKVVTIKDCHALKQITSDHTNRLCLPALKTLEITDCGLLEYVFTITDRLELPQLQWLALKKLERLTSFCPREFSFGSPSNLEVLEVEACPNLRISEMIKRSKLKDLCLSNVGNQLYEYIIQLQGEYFLSDLEKLRLKEISELKVIWKDPRQIATLQNLAFLEVFKCNKLGNIFSVVLARNLPQLSHLVVEECEELEQVVVQDRISSPPTTARHIPVFFPNLEVIRIRNCNKLKSLFPFKVRLPKLEKLEVNGASHLREIFGHDSEENKTTDEKAKEILLPELTELLLQNLPKFIGFSAVAYDFVFPALVTLRVTKCPSMIIGFYINDDSEGSYVLTKIEQSKSSTERNVERSVTMQNIGPHSNDDGNIEWDRHGTTSRSQDDK
ncbi:hypothetical protein DITRI_Ditri01bG0169300 [Diplodiscus trichospermus]